MDVYDLLSMHCLSHFTRYSVYVWDWMSCYILFLSVYVVFSLQVFRLKYLKHFLFPQPLYIHEPISIHLELAHVCLFPVTYLLGSNKTLSFKKLLIFLIMLEDICLSYRMMNCAKSWRTLTK